MARPRSTTKPKASIRDESLQARRDLFALTIPRGLIDLAISEFENAVQGRVPPSQLLTPETLRYMAERSKTFSAIMKRRGQQITQFAKRPLFDGDTGFEVVPRDKDHAMTPAERAEAHRIEEMLLHCGVVRDPNRKENLRTAMLKILYNTLVYDSIIIEPVLDSGGNLSAWYNLDGGSIQRTNPDVWEPLTEAGKKVAPIHYVQLEHEMVKAEWNAEELIVVVRNPSPVLERFGYGQPELEDMIDLVTIEVEILTWSRMVLANSSVPDGLLILTSNREEQPTFHPLSTGQMQEDMKRQWRNEVSGAQNAGRLVVFQVAQGESANFHETATKRRDMPFVEMFELTHNAICANMGIDPAELAVVEGALGKSSFVDSDAKASKLRYSRLNGLVYLLSILAEPLDQLIEMMNPNFCVMWRGVDTASEEERLNLETLEVKSGRMTLNELRAVGNRPPYPAECWWGDMPLIPPILNIEAAKRGIRVGGGAGGFGQSPDGQETGGRGTSGKPGSRVRGTPATPKDGN